MSKYVVDCDKNKLKLLSDDFCIEYLQQSGWMHQREKEIYEHGYSDGLDALKYTDGGELYAKGQNSAWKAAPEIVTPDNIGGKYTSNELRTIFGNEMLNIVTVRWHDGYLEEFRTTEVRFGCDLLWMRLEDGKNRHIPLRSVRWFGLSKESHQTIIPAGEEG